MLNRTKKYVPKLLLELREEQDKIITELGEKQREAADLRTKLHEVQCKITAEMKRWHDVTYSNQMKPKT